MISELKLEEGTFFDFLTHHPSTAAVTDADSGPTAEVFEDATDTTVVALTVTKRTSKTGNYRCPVTAAAASGFEVGKTYNVIASATVNGITGKGRIGQFKVTARGRDDLAFPLTSGRAIDVTAANKINGVVLVDTVTTYTGNTPQTGDSFARIGVAGAGLTNIDLPNQTMDITGNITGNLSGSVGSVTAGVTLAASAVTAIWAALTSALTTVGSIGKLLVDNVDAAISSRLATAGYTTPPTVGAIADQVWDEAISGHLGAGSTGAALNAAGSAGDPWTTPLPGAYGAGTAGKIIGDNINATISSRATQTSVDDVPTNAELATALGTADDAVLAQVALVKAKTDLIPAAPAAVGDIPTAIQNADAYLARDIGSGTNAVVLNERTVRSALRFNRNKFTIIGSTLTVYCENDSTIAFTAALATTAGDPVSSSDPV
jgi:hypothetical protein